MNTIEIKSSKIILILLFVGILMFIVLGLFLAIRPDKFVSIIFSNVFLIRIAGIVAALLSLFFSIILTKSLFTKEFNLIISEKGLIDNSSYASVGMIEWKDITSIESTKIMSTKFLIIEVKNPTKYLQNSNKLKKRILKGNFKTYGTPIAISSNTLTYNFERLEEVILKSFAEYKNNF